MPTHLALIAISLLALALAATPALGSPPKKGGAYVGELPETAARLEKRIVLKVSPSGTTGRVRLACGDTRVGVSSKFDVVKGKFTAKRQTGSLLVGRAGGTFPSPQG